VRVFAVDIVFLFVETKQSEDNIMVRRGRWVMYAAPGLGSKSEVTGDDGQRRQAITPGGVVNCVNGVMVVQAPYQFLEPCVATKDDPVDEGADKGVLGCALG
jgi:hypothetical protein